MRDNKGREKEKQKSDVFAMCFLFHLQEDKTRESIFFFSFFSPGNKVRLRPSPNCRDISDTLARKKYKQKWVGCSHIRKKYKQKGLESHSCFSKIKHTRLRRRKKSV